MGDCTLLNIQCEVAKPAIKGLNNGERGSDLTVQLDSATCSVGGDNQTTLEVTTRSPQCTRSCEEERSLSDCIGCTEWISYNFWRVNCFQESTIDYDSLAGASSLDNNNILDADLSYDFRFAMLVSNLTIAPTKNNDSAQTPTAHQTAAVICKIDYSLQASLVTQNLLENTTQVDTTPGAETSLGNLTSAAFGEILFVRLLESQNVLEDLVISAPALATEPLYTLLLNTLTGQQSMDRFLESKTLSSSASQVLAGLSAHFVRDNFLKSNDFVKSAAAVFVQDRLRIGAASLWTMVVGSILLSILAIGIILSRLSGILPHDPGYISTDALILASSSRLQKLLKPCNSMRTSELTSFLQDIKFRTDVKQSFQITPTSDKLVGGLNERKPKSSVWIPLSATYLIILPTLGVPLIAIIALELLYRVSKDNNGVVDVSGSEESATYISRYTSALIVLLIATCFNGLDFTVASFAPYSSMRSGAVPASKGLNLQILGVLPPVALDHSLRARHASSFFSNVAGMVGSTLTIIASGLWTIDRAVVVAHEDATASLATEWDLEWLNSSIYSDDGATKRFDQIQHGSALTSPTIWNGVVLPEIADIRSMVAGLFEPASRNFLAQNYAFQTYGLRPLLNRIAVAERYITIVDSKYPDDSTSRSLYVTAYPPLPPGCKSSGSTNSQDHHFISERIFSTIMYLGDIHDLPIHPDRSTRGLHSDQDDGKLDRLPGISQNCPSVGIIFAKVSGKRPLRDDVTALVCTQKIENVYVNVTYSGIDTLNPKIDPDTDPIVDEGSVRKITNQADGVDSFSYHIATYFNNTNPDPDTNITKFDCDPSVSLDPFLDHVAYGPTGTLPQDMFGKTNRSTLMQAIQRVYGRWMSLVIDMRSRKPMTEATRATLPEDQLLVHGTAYVTTSRLQLNEGSKLAMQILLGAMFGFGCLAYALTDLRGTLPRKPTSIASRMALLAGSDLCDEKKALIPPGAVWTRKKELDKVFDGWLFGLGWWQQDEIRGSDHVEEGSTCGEDRSPGEKQASSRRFGIDVEVPEQLGFRETKWWALRRRLARRRSKA